MLIISQDKKSIVIVENITQIYVEQIGEDDSYGIFCDYGIGVTRVAVYSSEERAMEELKSFANYYKNENRYDMRKEE